ncbi:membrane acyltransferase [Mycobacterium tuberculosis CCDC5079]|nr:membrane acyltransferase [Mycobacterium tuberculosis CCDC5079]
MLVTNGQVVGGTRGFLPAVEGMRACAAVGVVVTHVAFQTGHSSGVGGRLFGRFDLAVAVFFAVSGFLLWRGHAAAARDLRSHPRTGPYLRSRVARIMPAYVVAVVVILSLLPDADHASLTVWLANLTLTQIYVPLTLTGGLTQMWSLSVEVAFYAALPVLALLGRRIPVGARVPAIAALAALSWAWGWLPLDAGSGINPLTWPPAFFSWFAAGMLLAEWAYSPVGLPHRWARRRVAMAVTALLGYLVAASPLAGPEGLVPGTAAQFAVKTAMGSLVAFALVAPLVLDRPDTSHRLLGSPAMVTLGPLVLWPVHLASGRAGHGVSRDRSVPVYRANADGAGVDADLRFRDRRGQLRPGRVALPGSVAPLGAPQRTHIGRRTSGGRDCTLTRPADTWRAPSRSCPLARSTDRADRSRRR